MHPISYFQAIVLGLLQGIAEPFPISSLGHGVIAPSLFGWNIHQNDDFFLADHRAAGVLKLPELMGEAGDGVRGPALAGALAAALTTYLAVKFLLRFFETNRLTPFGIYCIAMGVFCTLVLGL